MLDEDLAHVIDLLEEEADAAFVLAEYPAAGERHVIGHVHAATPPAGLNLVQLICWQLGDQERMRTELDAQREAFFERMTGKVTLH